MPALKRGPERRLCFGPLRRQERALLRALGQERDIGPERGPKQRPLQYEDPGLVWRQEQHPEQALLRFNEPGLVRGPVIGPERGQERPLHSAPHRWLLPVMEQGPHKGQALPPLSGVRPLRKGGGPISDV